MRAAAVACANVALSKYWGKRPGRFNVPAVPSLSVTLDESLKAGLRVGIGPWLLAADLADELAFFRSGARRGC